MSTTSGLGSNYTTNTTSNLSASSLSSHPNISSPRRYGSSSSSDENMHSLAAYHQQQLQLHRIQAVQALKACETDIYFNNYGMEQQRSAYGGSNTPELSRASPYGSSRVPQMGLSATGHRRTLSSNYSGYSPQSYFVNHPPAIDHPVAAAVSKNPFLNMATSVTTPNRTYENVPFSPNRHLYADFYDKESCVTGTLRSSLKKKKSLPVEPREEDNHARKFVEPQPARESSGKDQYSFSSSGSRLRFSPPSPVDGKSYSSPSSS